jgi:DNA-directed RNA polymerase subunit M/transcription elongation factor TFIIS
MRFCPYCENLLIPRRRRLFCKVCNREFDLCSNDCVNEYRISISTHNKVERSEPLILNDSYSETELSNKIEQ